MIACKWMNETCSKKWSQFKKGTPFTVVLTLVCQDNVRFKVGSSLRFWIDKAV